MLEGFFPLCVNSQYLLLTGWEMILNHATNEVILFWHFARWQGFSFFPNCYFARSLIPRKLRGRANQVGWRAWNLHLHACMCVCVFFPLHLSGMKWLWDHDRAVLSVSHPQSFQQWASLGQKENWGPGESIVQSKTVHIYCIYFPVLCIYKQDPNCSFQLLLRAHSSLLHY